MALARMLKARAAVHKTAAGELASRLQALGCCEFLPAADNAEGGGAVDLRSRLRHVEELLGDVRFLVRLLEPMEKKKESSLARMLGNIPEVSLADLERRVDEVKFTDFVASAREKERKITECRADISRCKGLIAQAEQLEAIKYPLELFTGGTDSVAGVIAAIAKPASSQFERLLQETLGEYFELQELPGGSKSATVTFALLCRREDLDKVMDICGELSAARIDVAKDFALTAREERSRLTADIERLEHTEGELLAQLAAVADEKLEEARYCGDYWLIQKDRLDSMVSALSTEDVLIWSFWLPQENLPAVENEMKRFEALTDFAVVEPDEDEMPPSLLKNPRWSACMEPLTLMFGTPTYGRLDPTTLMAPFFFLFLGMCFGDAGYGLVLSGVLGYLLVRYNLPETLRKFASLMLIGMLCAVAYGAISGSFFGDSIDAFPFMSFLIPIKNKMQLLDPMNDPMTLLAISLGLGFVQIMFGLCIAMYENWKQGNRVAALADQGGWIILICGLLLFGFSAAGMITGPLADLTKYVALAGAAILVATQGREKANLFGKLFSGVMSLYNVTGYLGDVLSYSRLLALGLGSAAVGMVLNLLAKLLIGIPYVGIVLAVVVFVFGHIFSVAINLLGAFIHALRLQYVEFFGKFYDANGHDFSPLSNRTQFARLTDEPAAGPAN